MRRAGQQVPISFTRHGGARVGAGRHKKRDAGCSHSTREAWSGWQPAHVSLHVLEDIFNLRSQRCLAVVRAAFVAGGTRPDFRVVGLSIQGNHLHPVIEAASEAALASGMQGLKVRIARGLNRLMGRHGPVFSERYFAHVLRTPAEVRRALAYVAGNTRKHAAELGRKLPDDFVDPYTAGYFGGTVLLPPGMDGMVVEPQSWLLRHGWGPSILRRPLRSPLAGDGAGMLPFAVPSPAVPVSPADGTRIPGAGQESAIERAA
jgi:REP element-mobilizing transposase RayT